MKYAAIIGIILISTPLILRMQTAEPFSDGASYEQLRTSQLRGYDSLNAQPHRTTITDFVYRFNPQITLVILAAITLICLSMYQGDELFIFLLATSPAFIASFTTVSPAAPGFALISIGALLISKRQYYAVLLVPICFFLSFNLGILATITFIVISLIKGMRFIALGTSFFALLSGTAASFTAKSSLGFTSVSLENILGVFGATSGITIFLFFLGTIGYITSWRDNKRIEQMFALLIIPCGLFFESGLAILAAFLSYYAALALQFLWNREWHFEELKSVTFILMVCGIIFSTIVVEKSRIEIDTERVELVTFITSAYPVGTAIDAPEDVALILAYKGYPTALKEEASLAITREEKGLPAVYQRGTYWVYEQ